MAQTVELTPKEYRVQRGTRQRLASHLLIGVCVLVLFLLIAGLISQRTRQLRMEIQPLHAQQIDLQVWDAQVPLLLSELQIWKARGEYQKSLMRAPYWCGVLEDMARASGDSVRFESLSIAVQEPSEAASDSISDRFQLKLTGEARSDVDVIAFLSLFSNSPHVEQLGLDVSQAINPSDASSGILFSMTGTVK